MKKWVFCLVVLLLLGYGWTKWKTGISSLPDESLSGIEHGMKPDAPAQRDGFTIDVSEGMIYRGDLLLINKDHPVPDGIDAESEAVSLVRNPQLIDGFGVLDNRVLLSPRLAGKFSRMVKDAAQEGIAGFLISSGFRSEADQEELYRTLGAQIANPPGYSEHNVGLSMDIGSSQAEMSRAPEGKWLIDHSWKYGFVLRFPEDKTAITGVQFEPWHFRYVGLPHSAIMKEKNLVLEEYLAFLKDQQSVSTKVGEDRYHVFYYPVTRNSKIDVPVQGEYEISGNNQDGVIVTVRQSTGQGE
ncbi:D-alanyl-D-alanine carboxypeptidase family protein [Paenibacillus pinisoli]|uniref:D-alanyl-D-alanine carboxypeptidase family protein n=1 Tax=Paenibacillus pinisoli TaxID=1276110 RepID=A0A3A6PKX1_9BACL|nr:M15 family metallopeptidase [Paenibacillus pinisoli]RJX39948.1 D-alanyl-D-alanine carboxypeptidase family protein [Paenibacillus pinisoli]